MLCFYNMIPGKSSLIKKNPIFQLAGKKKKKKLTKKNGLKSVDSHSNVCSSNCKNVN